MIGYLDCTTGVSGDKFLGACIGAGASLEVVREAVKAVAPDVEIRVEPVLRAGVAGLSLRVEAHTPEPPCRTWAEIRETLLAAALSSRVRDRALATFELLAEAEARVHDTSPADVHFHEVGAADSIADIVGTAAALDDLRLDRLVCGPVAVGFGTVTTAHGVLPVPAPATALLLEGVPVHAGAAPGEATTPTGAALVRTHASSFGALPAMLLRRTGHGAGTRDTAPVANITRLLVGDRTDITLGVDGPSPSESGLAEEPVTVLAAAIDHLSPENLAECLERIRAAGALDAWQSPALMKKGRLGAEVTVVAAPGDAIRLATALADLTGALGVRMAPMTRLVTPRSHHPVDTSLGPVRVKVAGEGAARRVRIEHDDVAALARDRDLPPDRVARVLETEVEDVFSPPLHPGGNMPGDTRGNSSG